MRRKLVGAIVICLVFLGGYEANAISAPSRNSIVEPGSFSEGCTYVLYQDSGSFLANSCLTGGNDFKESTAQLLLSDVQTSLATSGGEVDVQKGDWTLSSIWPSVNMKALVTLKGEGPKTRLLPSPVNFDPINVSAVNVFNFNMVDKNNIEVSFVCDLVCSGQQQQSFPIDIAAVAALGGTLTFLGNYLRVEGTGAFPALETGYSVLFRNQTTFHTFKFKATLRVSTTTLSWFPLFMEPFKSDFSNFIGFYWTSSTNLRVRTSVGGVATEINTAITMDTNDHTYEISYKCCGTGQFVGFTFDGTNLGTPNTNIKAYPGSTLQNAIGPELEAGEPDGHTMACYLKTPFITPSTV